jgi:hypothetical protein
MQKSAGGSKSASTRVSDPIGAWSSIPSWVPAALLFVATIALYWPAMRCDFVNYDDQDYVTENVHVRAGLSWENLKWAFLNPVSNHWHPLTVLSHMAVCQVVGLNPWGHHLANVLLHALNVALVFVLLRRLTGATWRSLFVAALFGCHPVHVESVAWVSERKDVLSGCFGLLTLIFYVRYAQKPEAGSSWSVAGGRWSLSHLPSSIFYFLSLFFFALGLMSKPMLVTWPFVLLLLDYWPLKRFTIHDSRFTIFKTRLLEKIPFFVLALASCLVTFLVQKFEGGLAPNEDIPLGARGGNVPISYCRHLGKMFWPRNLAVFYPHPGYWPMTMVLLAGVFLCGVSALFFVKRRQFPFLLMGWLWFIGTLVPVIGLVQVGGQAMADRHT